MKITDVRTTMVAVPFARFGKFEPVTMWYFKRWASLHCVTFIDTDEGITGIATEGDQHLIDNVIKPLLIGKDPFEIENIEMELGSFKRNLLRLPPDIDLRTLSAIDGALWDIVGKACGQPLYRLWGGKINDPIPVRYWMDCRSPEEQAAEAKHAVERGWRAFKIKAGTGPQLDVERVRSIREAVGDDVQLCVDLNGSYPMHVAINTLKKMAEYNVAFVEEPIASIWPQDAGSLDAMADIRKITGVPIEVHSHGPNCSEFVTALIQKRAADALHLNVTFAGSILQCKRACAIAEAGGMVVTGQSNCAELGPRNALMLHLIASERAFKGTNDNSNHHLEPPSGDIIKEEFRTRNGALEVPEKPGLGVEIDEDKLVHYEELYRSGEYEHEPGYGLVDRSYWF